MKISISCQWKNQWKFQVPFQWKFHVRFEWKFQSHFNENFNAISMKIPILFQWKFNRFQSFLEFQIIRLYEYFALIFPLRVEYRICPKFQQKCPKFQYFSLINCSIIIYCLRHYHRANVDRLSKNSNWKLTLTSRDLVRTLDQVIHEFGHFELSRTLLRIMFFSLSIPIWNVRLKEMWVDTINNLNEELFSTECYTLNKYSLLRIFLGLWSGKYLTISWLA